MIPTFTAEAALQETRGRYRTSVFPHAGPGQELVAALEFGPGALTSTTLGGLPQASRQNCFLFCAQHFVRDTDCPLKRGPSGGLYRPTHCWREVCETICVPKPA